LLIVAALMMSLNSPLNQESLARKRSTTTLALSSFIDLTKAHR